MNTNSLTNPFLNSAIVSVVVEAVKQLFNSDLLANHKTHIAAAGLFGLAVYQLSQGQVETALATLLAALTAIGLRHETAPSALPATA